MRYHCLGGEHFIRAPSERHTNVILVGSIGSLIATNLASLSSNKVRLVLRRKDLASHLLAASSAASAAAVRAEPLATLRIERDGLVKRTEGLEVEMTASLEDRELELGGGQSSKIIRNYPNLIRNDPIETLIITTKAPSTIPSIQSLLPRLSSASTIVICQNGMGVLEGLLDRYWPDDNSTSGMLGYGSGGGRPSFICATTTHGVWRKSASHFVHAGMGDIKFGVVPNRAVTESISRTVSPSWGSNYNNPLLNPRSLVSPNLSHIPLNETTHSLHSTLKDLLQIHLHPAWLPLPTLQIAQLQKLAVNCSVNALTAVMGVHNGALVGSKGARDLISSISDECSAVFAAHLAREEGKWSPPPIYDEETLPNSIIPPHPSPPPLPASHPLSSASLTHYTLKVVFKTSVNLSSTLQDLLAIPASPYPPSPTLPSRTEVDFINGYVVALARRYGISAPITESLGTLVKLKEEMLRSGAIDRVVASRTPIPSPNLLPPQQSVIDSKKKVTERVQKYERLRERAGVTQDRRNDERRQFAENSRK